MGLCASRRVVVRSRENYLSAIFNHLDSDGNGVVTLSELLKTADHLSVAEVTAIKHEFESLDKDRNQALDRDEYVTAMMTTMLDTSDEDFKTWASIMMATKGFSRKQLSKYGVVVHGKDFKGTGGGKDADPMAGVDKNDASAVKEARRQRRLKDKLKKAEKMGKKLGFTEDGHHFHAATGKSKAELKKERTDKKGKQKMEATLDERLARRNTVRKLEILKQDKTDTAVHKIQSQMRGKLARRQSVILRKKKSEKRKDREAKDLAREKMAALPQFGLGYKGEAKNKGTKKRVHVQGNR